MLSRSAGRVSGRGRRARLPPAVVGGPDSWTAAERHASSDPPRAPTGASRGATTLNIADPAVRTAVLPV